MDIDFYHAVLQHPPQSQPEAIFNDENTMIWIDWRESGSEIVDTIAEKLIDLPLTVEEVDADNKVGYQLIIRQSDNSRTISPSAARDEQHLTLTAIDELISPQYQLRFAGDTNGSDTIGVVVERTEDWNSLYVKFGRRVNEHFCPVRELPDLMNTPGDQIDAAVLEYADRIG